MGLEDEKVLQERDSRRAKAQKKKQNRLAAFDNGDSDAVADWVGCSAETVHALVVGVVALGGAVIFGTSRDGGAHMLSLLLDDNKKTLWFAGDVVLEDKLAETLVKLAKLL